MSSDWLCKGSVVEVEIGERRERKRGRCSLTEGSRTEAGEQNRSREADEGTERETKQCCRRRGRGEELSTKKGRRRY